MTYVHRNLYGADFELVFFGQKDHRGGGIKMGDLSFMNGVHLSVYGWEVVCLSVCPVACTINIYDRRFYNCKDIGLYYKTRDNQN